MAGEGDFAAIRAAKDLPASVGSVMHIPWYGTVFRGDRLERALNEIAPLALRYGATDYRVLRSRDDTYKFMQLATFLDPVDWERYWEGPEFVAWRARHGGWFQVPVLYGWFDMVGQGSIDHAALELNGR